MKSSSLACLGAALLVAGTASAATTLTVGSHNDPSSGRFGKPRTFGAGGVSVTATAWSLLAGTTPSEEAGLGHHVDRTKLYGIKFTSVPDTGGSLLLLGIGLGALGFVARKPKAEA